MSAAKTTGRRTPLSLSGATSISKMNNKPSPSPGPITENRKESTNQKTDLDKSTNKDNSTIQDKKQQSSGSNAAGSEKKLTNQQSTESNSSSSSSSVPSNLKKSDISVSRDSPRKDAKSSQNGVTGKTSNGNTKQTNSENSLKVDKTSDKDKQTNSSNAQLNNEKNNFSKDKPPSKNDTINKSSSSAAATTEKSHKPNTVQQSKDDLKKTNKSDSPLTIASEKKKETLKKQTNTNETNNIDNELKSSNTNAHQQKKDTAGATNVSDKKNKKLLEVTVDLTGDDQKTAGNDISEKKKTSAPSTPTRSSTTAAAAKSSPSGKSKKQQQQPAIQNEDVEMMETLAFDADDVEPIAIAASTPGKIVKRKDGPPPIIEQPKEPITTSLYSEWDIPLERKFSGKFTVSGRRSIHPSGGDYKPMQGVYRKMKTDLDASSNTNTSLNVTVGSEVPNNSSFSFFGYGRKRDRTPPNSRSELADTELSPKSPKRARIDMSGFLNVFSSPITLLRSRFSKTSIQSSTPVKVHSTLEQEEKPQLNDEDKIIDESLNKDEVDDEVEYDITVGKEADIEEEEEENQILDVDVSLAEEEGEEENIDINCVQPEDDASEMKNDPLNSGTQQIPGAENTDDIKVTVTNIADKKRQNCTIM